MLFVENIKDEQENINPARDYETETEDNSTTNSNLKEALGLKYNAVTARWIFENRKIDMSERNIARIHEEINSQNLKGWPSYFQPDVTKCPKCNSEDLTELQTHQGSQQAYFLNRDEMKPVVFQVRKCIKCTFLVQANHPLCLNIGDNLMVTLDRLFLMQSMVTTTSPPSTAASIVLKATSRSCKYLASKSSAEKEWIIRRLVAGYFALEALDKDEEWSQICAFCGINPDMTLSDGGEDICVTLVDEHFDSTPGHEDGTFTSNDLDSFTDRLKIFHIEALVNTGLHFKQQFVCNISNTPPFLLKAYRGNTIYNTETQKNTRFLEAKSIRGEQQLLIDMIEQGKFSLDDLSDDNPHRANKQTLATLMRGMGFTIKEIKSMRSNVEKKKAIMDLYESILSGYR